MAETATHDIVFAEIDGFPLKLDLTMPGGVERPPLVVWIHGGGWRQGSRKNSRMAWLPEHGYALASISYRLTDRAVFPAQIHDCKAAVRWLRAHADRFGYDPARIAVAGSSAGGHLAMLLGVSAGIPELEGCVGGNLEQSSAVSPVLNYFGPSDFILRAETQPCSADSEARGSFLLLNGRATGRIDMDLARAASPAFRVGPQSPPMLTMHGLADETVLPDQARRIAHAYEQAGAPHELHMVPGLGHGARQLFEGKHRLAALDFLRRHL